MDTNKIITFVNSRIDEHENFKQNDEFDFPNSATNWDEANGFYEAMLLTRDKIRE